MKITLYGEEKHIEKIKEIENKLKRKDIITYSKKYQKELDLSLPINSTKNKEKKLIHKFEKTYHDQIKKSDAILVVNPENKITQKILSDMQLAKLLDKKIYILKPIKDQYTEQIKQISPINIMGNLSKIK